MNENEQTVVDEVDEQVLAQPAAETEDARIESDLDKLLDEYDQEVAQSKPEPAVETPDQTARLESLERKLIERDHESAMADAITKVRGDLDPEFADNAFVKGWLNAQAESDPRLAKAWQERETDPKKFNRVLEKLGQEFGSKFKSLPNEKATNDRELVAAAVKGASEKAPDTSEIDEKAIAKMSDSQFNEWVSKQAAS